MKKIRLMVSNDKTDLIWDMEVDPETVGEEASDLGFLLADKIRQLYEHETN